MDTAVSPPGDSVDTAVSPIWLLLSSCSCCCRFVVASCCRVVIVVVLKDVVASLSTHSDNQATKTTYTTKIRSHVHTSSPVTPLPPRPLTRPRPSRAAAAAARLLLHLIPVQPLPPLLVVVLLHLGEGGAQEAMRDLVPVGKLRQELPASHSWYKVGRRV